MVRFQIELKNWYQQNKRDLPWRHTKNPYKVWLSEVILQQTRVAQGLSYYQRFVSSFPTVTDLAMASEQEVLNLWKGLGYYSRARNLLRTAKQVEHEHNGVFPNKYDDLIKLTGIGPYTAAAISSFCFDEQQAVLDGNVFRVLSRVNDLSTPINTSKGMKEFSLLAKTYLNLKDPATHNQAIMEFGALHCTPKKPKCSTCPFTIECLALKNGNIEERPQKLKKLKKKSRYLLYKVYTDSKAKKVFMKQRTEKDIWLNLYDFELQEFLTEGEFNAVVNQKKELNFKQKTHKLTHQTLYVGFVQEEVGPTTKINTALKPYSKKELENLPVAALHQKYIEESLGFLAS